MLRLPRTQAFEILGLPLLRNLLNVSHSPAAQLRQCLYIFFSSSVADAASVSLQH